MAGHASGWTKIATGPLKGRSVFISKAMAEGAGGREGLIMLLGQGNRGAVGRVMGNQPTGTAQPAMGRRVALDALDESSITALMKSRDVMERGSGGARRAAESSYNVARLARQAGDMGSADAMEREGDQSTRLALVVEEGQRRLAAQQASQAPANRAEALGAIRAGRTNGADLVRSFRDENGAAKNLSMADLEAIARELNSDNPSAAQAMVEASRFGGRTAQISLASNSGIVSRAPSRRKKATAQAETPAISSLADLPIAPRARERPFGATLARGERIETLNLAVRRPDPVTDKQTNYRLPVEAVRIGTAMFHRDPNEENDSGFFVSQADTGLFAGSVATIVKAREAAARYARDGFSAETYNALVADGVIEEQGEYQTRLGRLNRAASNRRSQASRASVADEVIAAIPAGPRRQQPYAGHEIEALKRTTLSRMLTFEKPGAGGVTRVAMWTNRRDPNIAAKGKMSILVEHPDGTTTTATWPMTKMDQFFRQMGNARPIAIS